MNKIFLLQFFLIYTVKSIPIDSPNREQNYNSLVINTTILNKNVIIYCGSIDEDHLFSFWKMPDYYQTIVGPSNTFNTSKYDFKVLSGELIIKNISINDDGLYDCVSIGVRNSNVKIRTVLLKINYANYIVAEEPISINLIATVFCVSLTILILYFVYILYKKRASKKATNNYDRCNDDESSDTEMFSQSSMAEKEEFKEICTSIDGIATLK